MTASTPQQPFLCVSRGWPLSGSAPPVFNDHIGAYSVEKLPKGSSDA